MDHRLTKAEVVWPSHQPLPILNHLGIAKHGYLMMLSFRNVCPLSLTLSRRLFH